MTNDQIATELGWQIRRCRKEAGLTQQELGLKAGCGIAFVNTLENGKATARMDKILDVLRALNLRLSVLPVQGAAAMAASQSFTQAQAPAPALTRKFDFLD